MKIDLGNIVNEVKNEIGNLIPSSQAPAAGGARALPFLPLSMFMPMQQMQPKAMLPQPAVNGAPQQAPMIPQQPAAPPDTQAPNAPLLQGSAPQGAGNLKFGPLEYHPSVGLHVKVV